MPFDVHLSLKCWQCLNTVYAAYDVFLEPTSADKSKTHYIVQPLQQLVHLLSASLPLSFMSHQRAETIPADIGVEAEYKLY